MFRTFIDIVGISAKWAKSNEIEFLLRNILFSFEATHFPIECTFFASLECTDCESLDFLVKVRCFSEYWTVNMNTFRKAYTPHTMFDETLPVISYRISFVNYALETFFTNEFNPYVVETIEPCVHMQWIWHAMAWHGMASTICSLHFNPLPLHWCSFLLLESKMVDIIVRLSYRFA